MPRKPLDGVHDFSRFRSGDCFYVDKTAFIREWWDGNAWNGVSLILRPHRFGKSLMMSTVEHFFSTRHAGRSDLFEGLDVWRDEKMRALQGTYPVISISLASVKASDPVTQRAQIASEIVSKYSEFQEEGAPDLVDSNEQRFFQSVSREMDDATLFESLKFLCMLLKRRHGKNVIVLLDEYDTPLQEAWLGRFWEPVVHILRGLFNSTFKNNDHLERAILTGITRVSKESMFSDLNNLRVFSVSTPKYMTSFGFTEDEVFAAMNEFGLTDHDGVRAMYDGYIFGNTSGIYNPWSVISYLQDPRLLPWWANTSSNAMAGKLVQEGSAELKQDFQILLEGGRIQSVINEQIVYDQLGDDASIWSLLLASGYLKTNCYDMASGRHTLSLTNGEIRQTMAGLVASWFKNAHSAYGNFIRAFLQGDVRYMNKFMNNVAYHCFSYFDTGSQPGQSEPERFYHGFVLGLLVDLRDRYILTSNRESGFGRYDVILEPRRPEEAHAYVLEFKVHDPEDEADLKATVAAALSQIEKKGYDQQLLERGIPADRIRKYGFAFRGKEVLIGQG